MTAKSHVNAVANWLLRPGWGLVWRLPVFLWMGPLGISLMFTPVYQLSLVSMIWMWVTVCDPDWDVTWKDKWRSGVFAGVFLGIVSLAYVVCFLGRAGVI